MRLANVSNNLVALIPLLHNSTCAGTLPTVRSSRTETLPKPLHDPWPREHGARTLTHRIYCYCNIRCKASNKKEKYSEYFGRVD